MNQTVKPPAEYEIRIAGNSSGGKDGGSNSTSGGTEAPNTLKSRQVARVIDLLSEGVIEGVVDGAKGVYFDGVPVQRSNGTFNFSGLTIQFRPGTQSQAPMTAFPSSEQEVPVGPLAIKFGHPLIRHIADTDADRCRITVSVPALSSANKDTGDVAGTTVTVQVLLSRNGGAFSRVLDITITGKTTSKYQRDVTIALTPPGPWDIKLDRLTADSTTQYLQNETYWDGYTEITDDKVGYANSAVVGVIVDAEQFRSIPKRVYDTEGLLIRVPSNYNPRGTYGPAMYSPATWDGQLLLKWSNNPAWVLFDLISNNRYGLGDFLGVPDNNSLQYLLADKWSFYTVGQWCDAPVRAKGTTGAYERRYTCNIQIRNQQEAFDLLAQMASIFRGFMYWAGGQMVCAADQLPADPADQFTNANVLNGQFSYSGGDVRQRHSQFLIGWNDPAQMGEARFINVEDQDAISKYGLQVSQEQAWGCTRESQAVRQGKWSLFTEQHEDESIQFTTGLQGAFLRPGSIVKVMDANIAGRRRGGRISSAQGSTYTDIYFDAPVYVQAGTTYQLSCVIPSGETATVQSRPARVSATGYVDHLHIDSGFSTPPRPDTIFVLTAPSLDATLWRVMSIRQAEADQYQVEGVRHYPTKWDVVEKNAAFSEPDVSDIKPKPDPVTNTKVVEYIVQTSSISLQVMVTFSWTSPAPLFDVFYHRKGDNWTHIRTDQHAVNVLVASGGTYEFQVTPIGNLGLKGPVSPTIVYTVIGLLAPPVTPTGFKVRVDGGIALFTWFPSTEIDVKVGGHYELRFAPQTTGAAWNTAQMVLPSIPGTASSVEANYQSGTWMLRSFHIDGRPSPSWATVIAQATDLRYVEFFRICENPGWTGTHNGTEIKYPQEWLVIGATGGLWDDQLDNMTTWPDVDTLPVPANSPRTPGQGVYTFAHTIDAGGAFSVRLSADILAFPFYINSATVDERAGLVDTWDNWDDAGTGLDGSVTILIGSTLDDPISPTAVWTPYERFINGEYYARAWRFQAVLQAPEGQNIGVETLCITGDFVSKADAAEDVLYSAVNTRVYFRIKFYNEPAVVITLQLAMAEDRIEVTSKTREYFDLKITMTSSGTNPVGARSFDWHARGY